MLSRARLLWRLTEIRHERRQANLNNRTVDYIMQHVLPDNVGREDLDWAVNNILHGFG